MSINLCYQCLTSVRLEVLLNEVKLNANAIEELLYPEQRVYISLGAKLQTERSWYELHALLNVGQWADQPLLAAALLGGKPIGKDFFYGPPRFMTASEVKEVSAALQLANESELKETFDTVVSPNAEVPLTNLGAEDFVYLWQTFVQVRDFFSKASHYGDAMLLWIC